MWAKQDFMLHLLRTLVNGYRQYQIINYQVLQLALGYLTRPQGSCCTEVRL